MKKIVVWVLILLFMVSLTGCEDSVQNVPELLEPVELGITTFTVQRDTIYTTRTLAGEIVPHVEELYFTTDGILDEIYVFPGDKVEEGQVLASLNVEATQKEIDRLDNEAYEISMVGKYTDRQIEADIGIAKVELEKLQAEGASQQACSEKELQIVQLEMQLKQAQELRNVELNNRYSSINTLQESLKTTQLTAPFAGSIVYVQDIRSGAAVQGYSTLLCIADDSRIALQTEYMKESIFTSADKLYAHILDKTYDITYLPYSTDAPPSTIQSIKDENSKFSVDAKPGELEIGQFAAVMVLHDYKENVLTLPSGTLRQDTIGYYVHKLVDGQPVRCDIKVGVKADTKFEILEGLSEGDVVCVNN